MKYDGKFTSNRVMCKQKANMCVLLLENQPARAQMSRVILLNSIHYYKL